MKRRTFTIVLAFWSALPTVLGATAADKPARPPNVLFFMADDLSAKDVGCYGSTKYRTPNIDALAAGGMRFRTAWATPICSPTRAEVLTGRYDVRTGWTWLVGATFQCKPMPAALMLEKHHTGFPSVLRKAGYTSMVTGKWMLHGTNQNVFGQMDALGFDEHCYWPIEPCYLPAEVGYAGPNQKFSRYWAPTLLHNKKLIQGGENEYGPDVIADKTIDFMRRHKDRPFYIHYGEMLPHLPAERTPDPDNPGQRRAGSIKASIEYADVILGRLVRALDELGLRRNTIVIVTGDNGTPNDGKGSKRKEEGVRVPFVVNCPGKVPAAVVTDELIDFADMFPTMIELAGAGGKLDPAYTHDGHSFAPLILAKPYTGRDWIYGSNGIIRDKRWLLDGQGKLWDCGDARDEKGYTDATNSADPAAQAARQRFKKVLAELRSATK